MTRRVPACLGRAEARAFDVPRSITVIESETLDQRLPRTTPEALGDAPGVFVQKTNHGGGAPYLRGLVGNQVLVMVDGIRLNNATFRYGPNQYLETVDPANIDRLEGALRFAAPQDRLASGDMADHRIAPGGTPGWTVFTVSGGHRLGERLELVGAAQNLFDTAYRTHGSGIDGYGRSVWVGLHAAFR